MLARESKSASARSSAESRLRGSVSEPAVLREGGGGGAAHLGADRTHCHPSKRADRTGKNDRDVKGITPVIMCLTGTESVPPQR